MGDHTFYSTCVNWPKELVDCPGGLCSCIDEEIEIGLEEFMAAVDVDHLVSFTHALGYTGPTTAYNDPDHPDHNPNSIAKSMDEDYQVGQFLGREVFYFKHSAIENVYIPEGWEPSTADINWDYEQENEVTPALIM